VAVITACWDKDRSQRKSAVEVFSLLNFFLGLTVKTQFDVFISHSRSVRPCLDHVVHHLTQFGYRVWYDQTELGEEGMSADRARSIRAVIANSKIVVACIDGAYQTNESCMYELRQARKAGGGKTVIALVMQETPLSWGSDELVELCQLKSSIFVDIGRNAALPWARDEGPDSDMLSALHKALQPLLRLLNDAGCYNNLQSSSQGGKNLWAARY
jgi:hypothetical protein